MKKYISLLALALAFLMLCACSNLSDYVTEALHKNDAPEETPAASEEPVNTVAIELSTDSVFGLVWDPDGSLNPLTSLSLNNQNLSFLIYEGLFEVGADYTAENVLCQSYEVSDDLRTYTFKISNNITFHNGKKLTADDVVYSINQALVNGTSVYNSRLHAINSVFKVDDYTVEIDLGSPYEQLPLILDIPIIPDGSIDDSRPSGTGPYKLTGSGDSAALESNDKWWREMELSVDIIHLHAAGSTDKLRNDFETGVVDMLSFDPTGSTKIAFHNDYELFDYGTTILQYVGFNFYSDVFCFESARKAVCRAIDRDTIVTDIYRGKADAAVLPCSTQSRLYDDSLATKYTFDEPMIKTCLTEGGFEELEKDGLMYKETSTMMQPCSVTFIVNSENSYKVQSAEKIVEVLNNNGFSVTLKLMSYDDYLTALNAGEFDMYMAEVKLPANFDLTSILNFDGYLNYGDATCDELNAAVRSALENSGAALDLYSDIYEHGLIAPVLFKRHAVVAARGVVTGLSPTAFNCFHGLTDWVIDLQS